MSSQHLVFVGLITLAVTGVFYVFVYPYLSGQVAAEKRQAQFKQGKTAKRSNERVVDQSKRRQQILESVKDIEGANKKKKNSLSARLLQSGLKMDIRKFIIFSAALGLASGIRPRACS